MKVFWLDDEKDEFTCDDECDEDFDDFDDEDEDDED